MNNVYVRAIGHKSNGHPFFGGYYWKQGILSRDEALRLSLKGALIGCDIVLLDTGEVIHHPHKTPLPAWTADLLTCQMVMASQVIPPMGSCQKRKPKPKSP